MSSAMILDPNDRQRALRAALRANDPAWAPLARRLREETPALLAEGPWSVRDKNVLPPSGDPHDFLGFAVYWWPNPTIVDGLPYVSRDGEVNPEHERYDGWRIRRLFAVVPALAEAAWWLGDTAAGSHAVHLVRTWFLDPATRMNPHLRYACHIPGVWDGSGWGVIDAHGLTDLLPALVLLAETSHWTAADQAAFNLWLAAYLDWLLTSEEGCFEADRPNNHGTAYDHQVVVLARHLGRDALACRVLGEVPYRRIGLQLEHNGRQPWENARTQSWAYSTLNLHLLMELADLAAPLGIDLWNYATGDGRSIRSTLDYMLPFALGQARWPWELITGWSGAGERWIALLRQAARAWSDPTWAEHIAHLDGFTPETLIASRQHLRHPPG
jgi:hypothetical protein